MMELGATGDMDLRIVIATVLIVRLTPARMGSRLLPKGKMQSVIHKEHQVWIIFKVLINFVLLFINQIITLSTLDNFFGCWRIGVTGACTDSIRGEG